MSALAVLHQGGWDEILLFFGAPIALFVLLRYLAYRRERDEPDVDEEGGES